MMTTYPTNETLPAANLCISDYIGGANWWQNSTILQSVHDLSEKLGIVLSVLLCADMYVNKSGFR